MKLAVLTEYSSQIGFGHVSRTLAIADCFFEIGWEVEYLIRESKKEDLAISYPFQLVEWSEVSSVKNILGNSDAVLIDSYKVTSATLSELAKNTSFPLTIIDSKLNYPDRGVLIFGSIYANKFELKGDFTVLSGRDYILFRKDFINAKKDFIVREEFGKIVITLGKFVKSSDITTILSVINKTLNHPVEISVVGTPIEDIEQNEYIQYYPFLETKKYVELLQTADLAITNGGQTLNESIALNIPTLAIEIADNQSENIFGWSNLGVVLTLGKISDANFHLNLEENLLRMKGRNERRLYSDRSKEVIDLNGAQRVLKYVLNGIKSY